MTNTEAQQIIANLIFILDGTLSDAELEALVMAGEALEDDWIPVEKGLPKPDTAVLIYAPFDTDGPMYTAVLDSVYGDWRDSINFAPSDATVTHWRHLPKGPEVD